MSKTLRNHTIKNALLVFSLLKEMVRLQEEVMERIPVNSFKKY